VESRQLDIQSRVGEQPAPPDYTQQLQRLMQQVGISSFQALCQQAGVSRWQIGRLRQGQIKQVRVEPLLKVAQVLQVSLKELLLIFGDATAVQFSSVDKSGNDESASLALRREYQRLEQQLLQQRQVLWQEFQQATLQSIESFLLQWPTAAYAAQNNPQAPAVRLLPLVRPIEQLLLAWGIETIGPVGAVAPYDPQIHQLMEETTQPGNPVKIRYVGYRQGAKLLYRAKVSPATSTV